VELEVLKKDLSEIIHILHIAERPIVKEVIQMDIELILAKIESLKNIFKEQFETKVSWTKVVTMKHKKYYCREHGVEDAFAVIPNRYNLLYNDSKSKNTPVNTDRLRMISPKHGGKEKMKYKRKVMEQKQHKVVIIGHSHATGYAAEVKHLLNNKFEVLGMVNSGSGMEFIKDTAKVKLHQLTKNDVVVVWGGSNDIARNNSTKGMKNILEFVMNATHTNVIIMSAPHRHDLIRNSCVNKKMKAFNRKLCKRLKRFKKVKMIGDQRKSLLHKTWTTFEHWRQRNYGKKDCCNYSVCAK
jgi:hypothetical protein